MPDASPIRWHLAHTTWFFETFVLKPNVPGYEPFHPAFEYLFNSYYNNVGEQFPRPKRGLLSRPGLSDVFDYRHAVDRAIANLFDRGGDEHTDLESIVELGLHHEQQHQELMLTDLKHLFFCNPLFPCYEPRATDFSITTSEIQWVTGAEGVRSIGHEGASFAYDNEGPRHEVLVHPHELSSRLVTCREFLEFMSDGGYRRPELWLSLGWQTRTEHGWQAPLYWHQVDGEWRRFSLAGLESVNPAEPVCHVSYFEADAFARWASCRLPTEQEWELMASDCPATEADNFLEAGHLHPAPATSNDHELPKQVFGDVWEWTSSPYIAYPGYQPPEGAIGEYNGKFMCNQQVLRGGSCASSRSHLRATYRNFFPPEARWQFSGIRLAR